MRARAYYNEFDPYAAEWLRELVALGTIPEGDVDERSIEDVKPTDLVGYTQHHFFAGVGGWPLALRAAGWPDERPVWTGSCPCQPFSAAGKGEGFADERHLWPAFHHLLGVLRPETVIGEQVDRALDWLDLVRLDLEAAGYAFGAVDLGAPLVGAPHIRQRLYWMAHDARLGRAIAPPQRARRRQPDLGGGDAPCVVAVGQLAKLADGHDAGPRLVEREQPGLGPWADADGRRAPIGVAHGDLDAQGAGPAGARGGDGPGDGGDAGGVADAPGEQADAPDEGGLHAQPAGPGATVGLAYGDGDGRGSGRIDHHGDGSADGTDASLGAPVLRASEPRLPPGIYESLSAALRANSRDALHGFWGSADWLLCRDGLWRPVEPGSFPLAHGLPKGALRGRRPCDLSGDEQAQAARGAVLKGYGNAIVLPLATEFVRAAMGSLEDAS